MFFEKKEKMSFMVKKRMNFMIKEIKEIKKIKKIKNDEEGQTSVEVILLIGSILVISIICGTYIYKINLEINNLYNETLTKGRLYLLNKI